MNEKILVPELGESITEATVSKWLKNKGDIVSADEPIVELETDKVNLEVPSPSSGILSEINSKDGDIVKVGAEIGTVSKSGSKNEQPKIEKNKNTQNVNNVINIEIEKKNKPKFKEEPLILKD